MVGYIAQTRQSMATAGNNILFGGGEMWSARPHSISVPSQGQQHHALDALFMCQTLSPFHAQTCALVTRSGMQYSARHGVPYMISWERKVQYTSSIRILGIVHALYIRTCTHRNSILFYISIPASSQYQQVMLYSS